MERPPIVASTHETSPLEQRVNSAYARAIGQHEVLRRMPSHELKPFIREILSEIDVLETAGERDRVPRLAVSPDVARSVGAIWTFAGPGTYDEPVKEDRYKHLPWARNMDRNRLNYTARLARHITEAALNVSLKGPLGAVEKIKERTKNAMREAGPAIIYNGAPIENKTVRDVLAREGTVVPAERVFVLGEGINNTVDQIKDFVLPDGVLAGGKKLALVSHAPHLARIVRMLNRYRPLPEGTEILLFPLPTPAEGKEEYAEMETAGILYYVYVSPHHDATRAPYPYHMNELASPLSS